LLKTKSAVKPVVEPIVTKATIKKAVAKPAVASVTVKKAVAKKSVKHTK